MKTERWRRLACFSLALAAILCGSTVYYAAREKRYAEYLEATQRKGLSQLMNSLSSAQDALERAKYTPEGGLRTRLAAEVWKECASAESALSALPAEGNQVEKLSRYLSITGDYAYSLFSTAANGAFEEEAWSRLFALTESAASLSRSIAPIKESGDCGSMTFQTLFSDGGDRYSESIASVNEDFPEMEELIYDGMYSDGNLNVSAAAPEGEDPCAEKVLEENAGKLLGEGAELLGKTAGSIPCSIYESGMKTAAFSSDGGHLLFYCDSREIGEKQITEEEAVRSAEAFVKLIGLTGMNPVETEDQGGLLTVRMACGDNGVTAYPDCVRIGVAMDDGSVVRWDASDYLMHHRSRDPADPKISREDAAGALPAALSPSEGELVYVPTPGGAERLCWSFSSSAKDETKVTVLVDASTGQVYDVAVDR